MRRRAVVCVVRPKGEVVQIPSGDTVERIAGSMELHVFNRGQKKIAVFIHGEWVFAAKCYPESIVSIHDPAE